MDIIHPDFQIAKSLELPKDEVQLWRVDLESLRTEENRWYSRLSEDEQIRADRFHFPRDRQLFTASRAILKIILASYLATEPNAVTFSYSEKQKPALGAVHAASDITFNISHSGGMGLMAFTRRREIGVDIEQVRRDFEVEGIANRFFSENEQAQLANLPGIDRFEGFFRCWTRKEAYVKATGDGLSLPLHQFDVSIASSETNALLATRPDNAESALWSLRDVTAPAGYVAAICVHGHEWHLRG
ncbi:MAG: 4'-phosphopantetheinyl transferase superfamily protein [Candidatus Sulfotelmatobacter sp.]